MERFTAQDGVSIAYHTFGEAVQGPLVVMQHGFAASAQLNWVGPGIVDALVKAGRRVLAIDARGHGQSDKPHDPKVYGETAMARDLMGIVDKFGATSYDLVGYSMGAVVALLVAAQDRRVRRLAVGGVGEGVILCGGVDTRVMPNLPLAAALEGGAKGDVSASAAGMVAFVEALGGDRKALAAQLRAVNASPIALDRIAAPTLVLAGDDDPLAARPEVLASAIAGAKLERLSGDHLRALRDPRCIPALLAHLAA
jgi:pimeloyl-ACP methyl ester carboxylesterase